MAPFKGLVTRYYLLKLTVTLLEFLTAKDDGQAFCPGPAGSELERLLAKTEQAAWLIERRGKMSTLRLRQQRPRAALENVEKVTAGKQGQHKRRCGQ